MKKTEIQQRLQDISTNFDKENFIYDFLLSFGLSKTTITRLKKGDYNLSKNQGELFYKGKIFFKSLAEGSLIDTIDELSKEDRKSTRLNSSHVRISYAVFCLKKKKD